MGVRLILEGTNASICQGLVVRSVMEIWLQGGYKNLSEKKKGLRFPCKPLIYLVAGAGFEPTTFGL